LLQRFGDEREPPDATGGIVAFLDGWDRVRTDWSDECIREIVESDVNRERAESVITDLRVAAKVLAQAEAVWNDEFPIAHKRERRRGSPRSRQPSRTTRGKPVTGVSRVTTSTAL
jgi:hypothetical protein